MEIKNNISSKVIKLQKKKLKCPACNKKSIEPYIPFCSKKCGDLDLIKWLSDEERSNNS